MKSSSILVPAAVLAALLVAVPASAVPAAAVYTMSGAIVTQKLTVSGCSAATFGSVATATFFADKSYSVVRTGAGDTVPAQTGTYSVVNASSSYTVYMSPDDASMTALVGNNTGFDHSAFYPNVVGSLGALALANCQVKYPAATMSILAPTIVTSKNVMVVKNTNKAATLTYVMKGKQTNTFKGAAKTASFGATITMKGNVVETPALMM